MAKFGLLLLLLAVFGGTTIDGSFVVDDNLGYLFARGVIASLFAPSSPSPKLVIVVVAASFVLL